MDNNTILQPLEKLEPNGSLSGEVGSNRAPTFIVKQIAAKNDLEAIRCWLAEFSNSPQTLRNYRKEAERLLLWALIEKHKALSSLTRDDFREYQDFLADPQPFERWCGPRKKRHDPQWRPFLGPLKKESVAQAITTINALLSYLVEAGYLSGNPLGLIRRKAKKYKADKINLIERFLEQPLWQVVLDHIEAMPQKTWREKKEYERIRFLFHFLYLLGPRVSEVAQAKMQNIKQIRGKWWWEVTGKGQKTQLIPINPTMLEALFRYRKLYQLTHVSKEANSPLFMSLNGTKGVSANMIYRLVKKIFIQCAKNVENSRPDFAEKLNKASTHWLRHTSITHQADAGIELRYIKRSARHENVSTTMLYQHAEDEKWHEAMSSLIIR